VPALSKGLAGMWDCECLTSQTYKKIKMITASVTGSVTQLSLVSSIFSARHRYSHSRTSRWREAPVASEEEEEEEEESGESPDPDPTVLSFPRPRILSQSLELDRPNEPASAVARVGRVRRGERTK